MHVLENICPWALVTIKTDSILVTICVNVCVRYVTVTTGDTLTLLWAEFPSIHERYKDDFMMNYSEPVRGIMQAYGGKPYISVCTYRYCRPSSVVCDKSHVLLIHVYINTDVTCLYDIFKK